jgi:hypothetical protein
MLKIATKLIARCSVFAFAGSATAADLTDAEMEANMPTSHHQSFPSGRYQLGKRVWAILEIKWDGYRIPSDVIG